MLVKSVPSLLAQVNAQRACPEQRCLLQQPEVLHKPAHHRSHSTGRCTKAVLPIAAGELAEVLTSSSFGCVVRRYLPSLLAQIKGQRAAPKQQYLLLQALAEVLAVLIAASEGHSAAASPAGLSVSDGAQCVAVQPCWHLLLSALAGWLVLSHAVPVYRHLCMLGSANEGRGTIISP